MEHPQHRPVLTFARHRAQEIARERKARADESVRMQQRIAAGGRAYLSERFGENDRAVQSFRAVQKARGKKTTNGGFGAVTRR